MELFSLTLILSSLFTTCLTAPHNHHLEERQHDVTYTITCLGPQCTDYPPTTLIIPSISIPGGGNPQPTTTTKPTSPKTTTTPKTEPPKTTTRKPEPSKTSATSKYTPPPETPTKTIKSTQQPSKTKTEASGPSSTKCPVPLYYQCGGYYGGVPWSGCTKCVSGAKCTLQNDFYYQCVADE